MLLDLPNEILNYIFVDFLQMKKSKLVCKYLNEVVTFKSEVLYIYSNEELLKTFEKTQDDFLIKYIRVYDCNCDYLIKTKRFKRLFRIDLINCCGINTDDQLKTVLLPKTIIGIDKKERSGINDLISTDCLASIDYSYEKIFSFHESKISQNHDLLLNVIIESNEEYDVIKNIYLFIEQSDIKITNIIRMSETKYLLCMFPINVLVNQYLETRINCKFKANIYIENLYISPRSVFMSSFHSDNNGLKCPFYMNIKNYKSNKIKSIGGLYMMKEPFKNPFKINKEGIPKEFIYNELINTEQYKLKKDQDFNYFKNPHLFGSINNYNLENFGKGSFVISKE